MGLIVVAAAQGDARPIQSRRSSRKHLQGPLESDYSAQRFWRESHLGIELPIQPTQADPQFVRQIESRQRASRPRDKLDRSIHHAVATYILFQLCEQYLLNMPDALRRRTEVAES